MTSSIDQNQGLSASAATPPTVAFVPDGIEPATGLDQRLQSTGELEEALRDCVGALQFILAFYEPGQRYLDTEAWKQACASGVKAYHRGAEAIGFAALEYRADNGSVYRAKAVQS